MAFLHGAVPTTICVHPTPLYEPVVVFALAGSLRSAPGFIVRAGASP
jgi:phosphatidylglycerol---prolipoprotein diacylglyceryl transferase